MSEFDPLYGELLTSREVADLTGFTLNQLRNQRQRPDTAPFGWLRQGGTSWYRRDDIVLWMEANGGVLKEYVVVPNAASAPLRNLSVDPEVRARLLELSRINTSNAWGSKGTWLIEKSGLEDAYTRVEGWAKELWAEHIGLPADQVAYLPYHRRNEGLEQYWSSLVWAVRRGFATVYDLEVSNREIMDMPVGDVPPAKIV